MLLLVVGCARAEQKPTQTAATAITVPEVTETPVVPTAASLPTQEVQSAPESSQTSENQSISANSQMLPQNENYISSMEELVNINLQDPIERTLGNMYALHHVNNPQALRGIEIGSFINTRGETVSSIIDVDGQLSYDVTIRDRYLEQNEVFLILVRTKNIFSQ